MTILTNSATLTVSSGATVTASVTATVIAGVGYGAGGKGRLIHPIIGTYDYQLGPDEWTNLMADVVIAPIWSNNLTLSGATNALWAGSIKDVLCEEHWNADGGLAMPAAQFAMLISMFQTPPDPGSGTYVLWYPNYATALGYQVLIEDITVQGLNGAGKINLDMYSLAGNIAGAVILSLRIIGRAP